MHKVKVRLTIDLIPEFDVVVYREGESPENYLVDAEMLLTEEVEEAIAETEEEVTTLESDVSPSEVVDEIAELEEAEEPAE